MLGNALVILSDRPFPLLTLLQEQTKRVASRKAKLWPETGLGKFSTKNIHLYAYKLPPIKRRRSLTIVIFPLPFSEKNVVIGPSEWVFDPAVACFSPAGIIPEPVTVRS